MTTDAGDRHADVSVETSETSSVDTGVTPDDAIFGDAARETRESLDRGPDRSDGGSAEVLQHPTSTRCGDGIRDPITEECDDGPGEGGSACTADCHARAASVAISSGQRDAGPEAPAFVPRLGSGPHVAAGSDLDLAVVYGETGDVPVVKLQPFSAGGRPVGAPIDVAADFSPVPASNPVVARGPDGRYLVAWTDSMAGPPQVRLRAVNGRTSGTSRLAHENVAGLHTDPDLLWTAGRLVVAYTDLLDVRYRLFDADLTPLGSEGVVAATSAIESSVSLAEFRGDWAAAVRANIEGFESIVIKSGALSWSTPPAWPGPAGDRPAVAALDAERILVVFTVGADPNDGGAGAVGRLLGAVADVKAPGPLVPFAIHAGAAADTPPDGVSQRRPTATRVGDRVYVGWTNGVPGDAMTDQVFMTEVGDDGTAAKNLTFAPARTLPLAAAEAPRQANLRLAASSLFPGGALIALWERASDTSALTAVDLVLDLRPSPFVFLK